MATFVIVYLVILFLLLFVAVGVLVFKEGRIEVGPMEAVVYKNIWSGAAYALASGTHLIIPGIHKVLTTVTLKNEPSDPPITKVVTADPIELGIDYVIYTQQVVNDPGSIVKVATEIDYAKRRDFIIDRIEAELQKAISRVKFEEIYRPEGKNGQKAGVNREKLNDLEIEVNIELTKYIQNEWGVKVVVRLEDVDFPSKVEEVAEEKATAKQEGQAIKTKAKAAGVPPWLVAAGDILTDVLTSRSKRGKAQEKQKKGGQS